MEILSLKDILNIKDKKVQLEMLKQLQELDRIQREKDYRETERNKRIDYFNGLDLRVIYNLCDKDLNHVNDKIVIIDCADFNNIRDFITGTSFKNIELCVLASDDSNIIKPVSLKYLLQKELDGTKKTYKYKGKVIDRKNELDCYLLKFSDPKYINTYSKKRNSLMRAFDIENKEMII